MQKLLRETFYVREKGECMQAPGRGAVATNCETMGLFH